MCCPIAVPKRCSPLPTFCPNSSHCNAAFTGGATVDLHRRFVLEKILTSRECPIVEMPDPLKGEAARAIVVLHPGADLTVGEVIAYYREHLAAYKVPRHIELATELPKSATGKMLKRVLRDRTAGSGGRAGHRL
jgi:acyl-CoA synthetase (AMP-forming)/AMP-acid ligase II